MIGPTGRAEAATLLAARVRGVLLHPCLLSVLLPSLMPRAARQDALVESLNSTIAAGEALQNEVSANAEWQQNQYSFHLTVLGCVLSVLGFCSISIDALALLPTLRQGADEVDSTHAALTHAEQQRADMDELLSG